MTETTEFPTQTLYASFADAAFAEKAAGALLDHGVRAEDLSVVSNWNDDLGPTDFDRNNQPAYQKVDEDRETGWRHADDRRDNQERKDDTEHDAKSGLSTTTPGDAAAGAAKGAGIGLGAGIAAALASVFIPGFGLVLGGGALATAIAGAAGATAAGAVAGGVHGFLKDQGIPDETAKRYEEAYRNGGAIMAVHTPSNKVDRATIEELLNKYGAADIGTYGPVGEATFAEAA